ncbi:MAG: hypothetical protein HW405_580 [Candidatus Berkelbacteria bacterium]|nr:hypothetical protein [Candidatus Berkelbacteria bacterium]
MKHDPEYFLTRIIIIIGVLGIGFFGAKIIANICYDKWTTEASNLGDFKDRYENKINLETDPYELGKIGMSLLKGDHNEIALKAFAKAAQLDPNWRDGWVWKSYSELKLNEPKTALESLKKAEKIDPIYPLTYQLLTIAYQQIDDPQSAKFTQDKLVYLTKTYPKSIK